MTGPEPKCRSYPDLPWVSEQADRLWLDVMVGICLSCPALLACRSYAADLEARGFDVFGVWGGEVRSDRVREAVGV